LVAADRIRRHMKLPLPLTIALTLLLLAQVVPTSGLAGRHSCPEEADREGREKGGPGRLGDDREKGRPGRL